MARIGIGFRKFRRAEESGRKLKKFAEHGDNDRKSIVFRDRERSATKRGEGIMTTRLLLDQLGVRAMAWKRKKDHGKSLCGTREKENVQGERFLTNLIRSRETRLERFLRNLVWKFNNERGTFGKEIAHAFVSRLRKVKLYKFLFTLSFCCALKPLPPSFPNKI